MDALPLELHAQIFEFACTDDGSTARSLSLVSRYVRDIAAPYLYQSLAIAGLEQMHELVARLDVTPPHLRRIRHLFLSDWTHTQTKDRVVGTSDEAQDRYEAERILALRILAFAASTVETLAVTVSCPFTGPPILGALFSSPMPRLTELSVHGFYPFPHTPRSMPRLESLHLSGNRNPHGLLQLGALDAACPTLTHLRVSGLVAAASFAEELRSAIIHREDDANAHLSPLSASIPPALQCVAIEVRQLQSMVPRKTVVSRGMRLMHEKMLASLRELEGREEPTRYPRVIVAEKSEDSDMYSALKQDWLDGLTTPLEPLTPCS